MIYRETVQARVDDFGAGGQMTPGALLRVLENIAGHHSRAAGDNVLDKSLGGIAWILTEWRVEVPRPISYGETVQAETWASGKAPCSRAGRELLLKDGIGEILVRAAGKFALFDLKQRKPVRVSQEQLAPYGPEDRTVFDRELPRLQTPETFDEEKRVSPRRSDVDFNGHVHNAAYLDLALEVLSENLLARGVDRFRIGYRAPLQYGADVTLRRSDIPGGYAVSFSSGGTLCATACFEVAGFSRCQRVDEKEPLL